MAAVWLLSGYLGWKHRFLAFLAMVGICVGFGSGACLFYQLLVGSNEAIPTAIAVAFGAAMMQLALCLSGLLCRKRYGPVQLLAWSVPMSLVSTTVLMIPFFGFLFLTSPGRLPLKELCQSVGLMASMTFGTLVVYLVLSFATNFYRQRLIALLHLGVSEAPPVIAPTPAVELVGAK